MIRTWGRGAWASAVAARARARASSGLSRSPATPRTPSVPNSLRATAAGARSALGELRPLARLLQARLLALLGARVAREEAAALELAAQVGVGLQQRARDAVAQRSRLGRDPAAVQAGDDVHALLVADGLERLTDVAPERGSGEVLVQRTAVDRVGALARPQDDAGDRGLALSRRPITGAGGKVDGRRGDGGGGLFLFLDRRRLGLLDRRGRVLGLFGRRLGRSLLGRGLGGLRRRCLGGLLGGGLLGFFLGLGFGGGLGGLVRWALLARLLGHQLRISMGSGFWAAWGWSGPA